MTDKKIIRELEYQVKYGAGNPKALDLINRQQAENNRQKAEIEKLQLSRKQKIKEIERLKKGWKADVIETENIKAEAIKEFADRLKKHLKGNGGLYCVTTMNAQIDNLVKEMVGEGNAK